jgi:TetR/AcrR family transcriptional regulator, fatty acid biosynthesis regulator
MMVSGAGVGRALTREEGKLITRRRLVAAASRLLAEKGLAGVSGSAVARRAGVAQPTFYVHFRDRDDLLKTIAAEQIGALRTALREARERVRQGEGVDAIRDTFSLSLRTMVEQPELFRLYQQQFHQPSSPLGEQARQLFDELRRDLSEDLARIGMPSGTASERAQLDMTAEAMIAQTQALGLAYLEGRYQRLEDLVEVLTRFAVGVLGPGRT